jgi:hypothetical protein
MTYHGSTTYLYADAEADLRTAHEVVADVLARRGLRAERITLCRWHEGALRWEDASKPLPRTEEERAAERAERSLVETDDSAVRGWPEWEVRIELSSHRETRELGDRLEAEGVAVARRWRFLLLGAASEEDAQRLALRVRDEAPENTRVLAQGSGALAWQASAAKPFSYFETTV